MDIAAVEGGLICGYRLAPVRPLAGDLSSLPAPDDPGPFWLHFSLADARVEHWLRQASGLPRRRSPGACPKATNRNLEVLSIVTTALLPITLVTGVFGMNVGGLPGVNDPHGFRWVMALIVSAIVAVLVWLVRRRGQQ